MNNRYLVVGVGAFADHHNAARALRNSWDYIGLAMKLRGLSPGTTVTDRVTGKDIIVLNGEHKYV
jgi:hypothetical protein